MVDADLLAIKPTRLSFREAAALPLVFITAWEGLVDRAGVCGGRQVLIHGGAGGVGHIAVQLASAFGATVFATGSAQDRALIEGLARLRSTTGMPPSSSTLPSTPPVSASTSSTTPSAVQPSTPPSRRFAGSATS